MSLSAPLKPNAMKGMFYGFAGFAIFSFGDAISKYVTMRHPVMECVFFAEIGGIVAVLLQAMLTGGIRRQLGSKNPKIQALRALFLGFEFIFVLYAFSAMPLSVVYTLTLSAPVMTAFLAPLLTEDRFNPRILPAILLGFAGVVVAMHPGSVPMGVGPAAALLAALLFALGNLIVRRMKVEEPPLAFAFYPSLFALAVGAWFMATRQPDMPPVRDVLLMMAAGLSSIGGLGCLGRAVQLTPASRVMPFQYTQLVWGALYGVVVFGEHLNAYMITGAGLIVGSGVLLLLLVRYASPVRPKA